MHFLRHVRQFLTCFGRLLISGRILADTSPFCGDLAILPSNTAVYVFEGTASSIDRHVHGQKKERGDFSRYVNHMHRVQIVARSA